MEDARRFDYRFSGPEGLALDPAQAVIDSIDDFLDMLKPVFRSLGR